MNSTMDKPSGESLFSKLVNSNNKRQTSNKELEEYQPTPKASGRGHSSGNYDGYDPEDYVFKPSGYSTNSTAADPSTSPFYIPCYVTPLQLAQENQEEDNDFEFNDDEINALLELQSDEENITEKNEAEEPKTDEDENEEEAEDDTDERMEEDETVEAIEEDETEEVIEEDETVEVIEEDLEITDEDDEVEGEDESSENEKQSENSKCNLDKMTFEQLLAMSREEGTKTAPIEKKRVARKANEEYVPKVKVKKSVYTILAERYQKTQKTKEEAPILPITRKLRIAPVMNVQNILDEKKKLLSKKKIVTSAQTNKVRKAHQPIDSKTVRHVITEGSKNVPRTIRQYCFDKILVEVCKIYPTKDECLCESIKLEQDLFNSCTKIETYKAGFAKTILQLKSRINALHGKVKANGRGNNLSVLSVKKLNVNELTEKELYERLLYYKLTDEQLKQNGYPVEVETGKASCFFDLNFSYNKKYTYIRNTDVNRRFCVRCSKQYEIDPITFKQMKYGPNTCVYHTGRPRNTNMGRVYACCSGSDGCESNIFHVTECDYLSLDCAKTSGSKKKIYALDCEMVYTHVGIELARVSVVGYNKEIVYDKLVKPKYEILDYNTQFSGLNETNMKGVRITLKDVHAELSKLFGSDTILIGHSLDSDLRALRLIHSTVIDTSIVFPSRINPAFKRSLRELSATYLTKLIQIDESGHDAFEDAVSALELMLVKVKEDF